MPDSFFTSTKSRKRKRSESSAKPSNTRPHASKSKTSGKPSSSRVNGKASGAMLSTVGGARNKKGKSRKQADEELSDETDDEGAIEDLDLRGHDAEASGSGEEDENETPAEKRLRLAKLYLESVKKDLVTAEGEFDAAELDREIINTRLKQDVLEHAGKVHLFVGDLYDFTRLPRATLRTRGHRFSITSAVATSSGKYLFTSGKEGSIIKWDLWTGKKMITFHKVRPDVKGKSKAPSDGSEPRGHTDEVLALSVSEDGKYLVSAGQDRRLVVWDVEKGEWIKTFGTYLGHRDAISALAFRKGTHELYTASFDRTVKVYDLSPSVLGYVETLYGHQDQILALDALRGQTCVTVGGRDKTARYWKIVEESQLVFRGGGRSRLREVLEGGLKADEEEGEGSGDDGMDEDGEDGVSGSLSKRRRKQEMVKKFIEGSLECVSMIDENTFVTGGDSGSICLWTTQKKKPIFTQPVAHGFHETTSETEGLIRNPRWITSLASLRYSDVFASGSWDGDVRIWKLDSKLKSFSLAGTIPASGIVNSLQFVSPPKEFFDGAGWAFSSASHSSVGPPDGRTSEPAERKALGALRPLLLVAGLGQEHRLGRWLKLKEGVANGTLVIAIPPRTFSS